MPLDRLARSVCLISYCCCLIVGAAGPYKSQPCDWSEWRCRDLPDGGGCYAMRSRRCCGQPAAAPVASDSDTDGCLRDDFERQQLSTPEQQLSAGVICQRLPAGAALSSLSAAAVLDDWPPPPRCRPEPRFDGAKFPPPAWCPWTSWTDWRLECRTGLARMPQLAGLLALGNDSSGFKYSSRSRGCYCPASPDPANYTCLGERVLWRAAELTPTSGGGDGDCQWCGWSAWEPPCACPEQPPPPLLRRRRCLCSDGRLIPENATAPECRVGAEFESAPSPEAAGCPVCSRQRDASAAAGGGDQYYGYHRVSQFLNPLAIGFAVYLLVALGAFLLCKLFCGDPRQSDANSRDQLSVDDFLATPSAAAAAATSAV